MNLDVLTLDRRSGALLTATIAGIAANALQVRRRAQASQRKEERPSPKQREERSAGTKLATAVDANFARRLATILQIIVPSWRSPEASILLAQTLTLLCRTLLSLRIARCGGEGIKAVMHGSLSGFTRCLLDFSLTGLVAGVVNSALKFHTNLRTSRVQTAPAHTRRRASTRMQVPHRDEARSRVSILAAVRGTVPLTVFGSTAAKHTPSGWDWVDPPGTAPGRRIRHAPMCHTHGL